MNRMLESNDPPNLIRERLTLVLVRALVVVVVTQGDHRGGDPLNGRNAVGVPRLEPVTLLGGNLLCQLTCLSIGAGTELPDALTRSC